MSRDRANHEGVDQIDSVSEQIAGTPARGDRSSRPVDIDFAQLFREHRRPMVTLARMLTGSLEIAEDLVQEAFINIQNGPEPPFSPESYLRTIVTNLSRGYLRRLRIERAFDPEQRIVMPAADLDEPWVVMCRLPFRQRAVLALRYYEDLSEVEIARILGCRVGTVKSAHHRALAALRRKLT
jgi:RNA polymerase sigma factor (sigma-70 family)